MLTAETWKGRAHLLTFRDCSLANDEDVTVKLKKCDLSGKEVMARENSQSEEHVTDGEERG